MVWLCLLSPVGSVKVFECSVAPKNCSWLATNFSMDHNNWLITYHWSLNIDPTLKPKSPIISDDLHIFPRWVGQGNKIPPDHRRAQRWRVRVRLLAIAAQHHQMPSRALMGFKGRQRAFQGWSEKMFRCQVFRIFEWKQKTIFKLHNNIYMVAGQNVFSQKCARVVNSCHILSHPLNTMPIPPNTKKLPSNAKPNVQVNYFMGVLKS